MFDVSFSEIFLVFLLFLILKPSDSKAIMISFYKLQNNIRRFVGGVNAELKSNLNIEHDENEISTKYINIVDDIKNSTKGVVLCILDGFAIGDPDYKYNAVFRANSPNIKRIIKEYPMCFLKTSGEAVGLPEGQMGNSEVGHMTIGSGQVILQDLPRINKAIISGEFFQNNEIKQLITQFRSSVNAIHLIGLISDGGVHSHASHTVAIANHLARNNVKVKLHVVTDGRDVAPKSFLNYYKISFLPQLHNSVQIASVSGRYYAMDRDNKTERTQKYFDALYYPADTNAALSIEDHVENCYTNSITDEFITPVGITGYDGVKLGDGVIMSNFRSDRARQIFSMICDESIAANFTSTKLTMTEYSDEISRKSTALFIKKQINNCLAEVISRKGLKQLHIAETEKYAHVTFFFNGGRERPFDCEDRILVQSPNVATYDLKPEMSLLELEKHLIEAISDNKYHFIVCNIANGDMVGHSGDFEAAKKAVEHIDKFLSNLEQSVIEQGYDLLVTADHGNLEEMVDIKTGEIHTQHTLNDVPLIYIGDKTNIDLPNNGTLADIAGIVKKLLDV